MLDAGIEGGGGLEHRLERGESPTVHSRVLGGEPPTEYSSTPRRRALVLGLLPSTANLAPFFSCSLSDGSAVLPSTANMLFFAPCSASVLEVHEERLIELVRAVPRHVER